jgi:hypothetical protein
VRPRCQANQCPRAPEGVAFESGAAENSRARLAALGGILDGGDERHYVFAEALELV